MTSGSQTTWRRTILGAGAALALFSAFLRAAPDVGSRAGLNSDEAVAQLMANAPRLDLYAAFFWGQDRLGGWPFIFAWTLHKAAGVAWTGAGIYWLLVACWLSTLWPVWKLAGRWGLIGLALVLGQLAADADVRVFALSISQPYAWQLSTFFWAWWLLRCQTDVGRQPRSPGIEGPSRGLRVSATALALCLLSVWISPLSAGFLFIAAMGEVLRIPERAVRRRLLWRVPGTVVLSVGLEELIRLAYQRHAAVQHWRVNWTAAALDRGHYVQNAVSVWTQIRGRGLWPVAALALPLALTAFLIRRRRAQPHGVEQASDLGWLAVACALMAWLNATVVVTTSWARLNEYNPRYLVPSWILWALAFVWGVAALVDAAAPPVRRAGRLFLESCAAIALVASAVAMPRVEDTEALRSQARVAEALPARLPDGVLLGCYWGDLVFVDGAAAHALTPIVYHTDSQRMPWTDARLRASTDVLVSHDRCPATGTVDHPAEFIFDHGVLLELSQRAWFVEGPFGFSRYSNRTEWLLEGGVATRTVRAPLLHLPAPDGSGEALTVDVPAGTRHVLLLFEDRRRFGIPPLRAEAVDESGRTTPLTPTVGPNLVDAVLDGPSVARHVRFSYAGNVTTQVQVLGVAIGPGPG